MPISKWSDNIAIVQLTSEPTITDDMEALVSHLHDNPGCIDVIVNMQGVDSVNSSVLAHLLRIRKRLRDAGCRMRICSVSDPAWSIFLVTGLDQVFEFTEDVPTALASLQIE